MKKMIVLLFAGVLACISFPSGAASLKSELNQSEVKEKIEVYYFHFTRRCATCQAVETESKSALEALYPSQLKNGTISFKEVNLDNKNSKPAVEKAKAEGQSLIILKGDKRVDLTTKAFMYALSSPDKLQDEIKKAIDSMLSAN